VQTSGRGEGLWHGPPSRLRVPANKALDLVPMALVVVPGGGQVLGRQAGDRAEDVGVAPAEASPFDQAPDVNVRVPDAGPYLVTAPWRPSPSPDFAAWFASPEEVILKKLEYNREGRSEKHIRDSLGVLKVRGDRVDRGYIAEWANG
jgi:hypothetical protein